MRPPMRSMEGISTTVSSSARQPHGNSGARDLLLERADVCDSEMKDARRERGIGGAAQEDVGEMLGVACSARGDDGNLYGAADHCGQLAVEAVARAVGIHRSEQDFSCAAVFGLTRPVENLAVGGRATAVDVNLCICNRVGYRWVAL